MLPGSTATEGKRGNKSRKKTAMDEFPMEALKGANKMRGLHLFGLQN